MVIRVIQVPYDSGHRARRMGCGPLHLVDSGLSARLSHFGDVSVICTEVSTSFVTEIGSAFELHREVSKAVSSAYGDGDLPLVLSGNCNASLGTIAGIQNAGLGHGLGVVWLDGHGDCNTPETFDGDFLDAMGLSTLTGRCWQALANTVQGFRPLDDDAVLLLGGHAADHGARKILSSSGIGWLRSDAMSGDDGPRSLRGALDGLAGRGMTRLYLHLDVDVLDARHAVANEFAAESGLTPDQLYECLKEIVASFDVIAAGVASYDPGLDCDGRVREVAFRFLELVARARGCA